MPDKQVEAFELAYHPQQGCVVKIKLVGVPQVSILKVPSSEMAAIAAILNESPVYITKGWLHTGPEPPGE